MVKKTLKALCDLATKLRSETGCPWDRKQTIASMLECVESEVKEVREAIKMWKLNKLKEKVKK